MRLNRRQLRRLIETAIYEQDTWDDQKVKPGKPTFGVEGGKKLVVPKEVRAELKKLRLGGYTSLAFDKEGVNGLSILLFEIPKERDLALKRLKSIYGEDRVTSGSTARLQGGSAGIKDFDGKRLQTTGFEELFAYRRKVQSKEDMEQIFADGDDIFIKME